MSGGSWVQSPVWPSFLFNILLSHAQAKPSQAHTTLSGLGMGLHDVGVDDGGK